jgi:AraC-like DNA-binding protein
MDINKSFCVDIPIFNENFSDLNPVVAGYSQCAPAHKCRQTTRPFYLIHYVVSGKGIYMTDNNEPIYLKSGDIFIIHPHQKHIYMADQNDPWYYIWIGFDGSLSANFSLIPQTSSFSHPELFFNIRDSINTIQGRSEYLCAQLMMIYYYLMPQKSHSNKYSELIRHQIISNYMIPITVEDIAKYCKIHRNYASRIFKKEYGTTIHAFLTEYRMKKAYDFLSEGFSVEDVSSWCGFEDYTIFSRAFKKFYNISPSKVKKNIQHNFLPAEYVPDKNGNNPYLHQQT